MVSVCKLGGTINQTGVKGGKSKRSKIPPQSLSFSFSSRPRFSRFAAHHSPLDEPRDVRSIALKTLGKERDCSQSNDEIELTAPFNNMRTLKLKAQPTNSFFATINQTFGCSSQPSTAAERAVMKSLSTVQTTKQCTVVVGSLEEPPNIWLNGGSEKRRLCRLSIEHWSPHVIKRRSKACGPLVNNFK